MQGVSKILVPYDFSPLSQKALGSALLLARLVKAELHVVHVEVIHGVPITESPMAPAPAEALRARIEQDNTYINDLYKDVVIYYAVGRGVAPGPIIIDYQQSHQIDLIIIGTHGRHGLKRVFLGSVAEEIVRYATCEVLTITGGKSSFLEFDRLERILVPIDFSGHSAQALSLAREVAALSEAKLNLVHVVHFPSISTVTDAAVFSIVDYDADVETKAFEHLRAFYARVVGENEAVIYTVMQGPPADEIARHAAASNCDLIVIGTHGLTGLDRFLMGSVASKIIRRADCPVLVVHSAVHATAEGADAKHENLAV